MLTVICLFVRGEYPYTVEYVTHLRAGVAKHLDRPFRFVCLTDQPARMPAGVEAIAIQPYRTRHTFWTKLECFNPVHGFRGRMLYLDLDTLVVNDLAPIVDAPGPFTCAADLFGGQDRPVEGVQDGRLVRAKHQGSVIVYDAEAVKTLFTQWTPDLADRYYGCDDWMSDHYPDAPVLPLAWFPRISQVRPPWPTEAKVVLVKKPKNHLAAQQWPWFASAWRAA